MKKINLISLIKQHHFLWLVWSVFMFIALFCLIFIGNYEFSKEVNLFHTNILDVFFKYVTYLGDGILLYLLGIFFIFINRRMGTLTIFSLVFTTIVIQFLKRIVFADFFRPSKFFKELINEGTWHIVDGVKLYDSFSFPSGHTALAFCFFITICHFLKSNFWSVFFIIISFVIGYSRIYLSQHFLVDVWFGSLIGSVISLLTIKYSNNLISISPFFGKSI